MRWFRDKVNGGDTAINCFVKEDLDMTEGNTSTTTEEINGESVTCANWDPIGGIWGKDYSGIFNGGNKIVSNWAVQDKTYSGLFGSAGIIKNVNVDKCCVNCTTDKSKRNCGLICSVQSTTGSQISNCKTLSGSFINVKNGTSVGGIIGRMIATEGKNISLSKSYNTGNVAATNGASDAAGICSVMGNSTYSNVKGKGIHEIIDCYNAGNVSGKRYVGGVVSWPFQQSNGENIIENCHSFSSFSGGNVKGGILCIGFEGTTKVKNCYYNCAGNSSILAVGTSNENATVETEKVESKTEADFSDWVVRDLLDQGRNVWAQGTTYPIFVDVAEGEITLSWDKLNYKYNFGKWDVSARKYDNETGWVTPFPKLTAKSSSTNAKFRIYVTFTPNEDSMSPVDKKYFGIFDVDKLTGSPLDYIELAAAKNGSVQSKIVALKLLGILNGSAGKAFKQDSSNNRLGVFNIKVTY